VKALVNTGPGRLELLEMPRPTTGPGEVLIRTRSVGICATELEMIAGWERTGFPAIPGHEWFGEVAACGPEVPADWVGRACVGENVWPDGREVGFELPGGYAEFFVTKAANLHLLPEGFPFEVAPLMEPLAVCVRGMKRVRADYESPVLVLGDGPIGMLMAWLLARLKSPVLMVGGRPGRLRIARETGIRETADFHSFPGTQAEGIMAAFGRKFPTVVDATGAGDAMHAAMDVLERAGRILMVSSAGLDEARFLWTKILWGEIEIIGSNASEGGWPGAIRLAGSHELPLDRLVTHRLPVERFAEGLDLLRDESIAVLKVVLDWAR